jgi:prepilin peptidase dependent protein B
MLKARRDQTGLTLVELMIAALIALIALAAVVTSYVGTAHHTSEQLSRTHLRQQAQGALHLIIRDIRRAGYWYFDPRQQAAADNPFQTPDTALRTGAYPGEPPGSCVLFAYDMDRDGRVGIGRCDDPCPPQSDDDNVEQFGFRLRSGRLQFRYGGESFNCTGGYWQAVTDPGVEVTGLAFILHRRCLNLTTPDQPCSAGASRLNQHAVRITLSTRLRGREQTALDFDRWVQVRNDRLMDSTDE